MKRALAIILTSLSLLSITGCGWQLRGTVVNDDGKMVKIDELKPLPDIKLISDSRNTNFYRTMLDMLSARGINHDANAAIVVQLGEEQIDRKPLSYDSTGSPAQYLMTLSIRYQASQDGQILIEQREIKARRNYDFDPDTITAKDREQEELQNEMRRQLCDRILARIQQNL